MKQLGFLMALMVGLAGCGEGARMSLRGEAPTMRDGEKLYLVMGNDTVGTTTVKKGKFAFDMTGLEPDECLIARTSAAGEPEYAMVCLDFCDTYVRMGGECTNDFRSVDCVVEGNPTDSVVKEFRKTVFMKDIISLCQEPAFMEELRTIARRADMASAYVLGNNRQVVFTFLGLDDEVKDCLDRMSPEVRESAAGKDLQAAYAECVAANAPVEAPDFTLNTPEGKPIAMSEYVKGKKLVLIDFWASWCGPCRKEGENVKAIYADYRDKGFDVFGVSLDTKPEAWKKAIADDGIVWGQVSDLKGWKSPMCELYDFRGIPHLVLVDGEGRIVAKNLRGEALRKKVAEICK